MHGGTVGDGRGGSGPGRGEVGWGPSFVSGVRGIAAAVGVGACPRGARHHREASPASRAVSGVLDHACVVAGDGVAAPRVCRRCDRRGGDGPGRRGRSPPGRAAVAGAGGDGAWLVAQAGGASGTGPRVPGAGRCSRRRRCRGADGAGLPVAGPDRRARRGERRVDGPVRAGRCPRPGDGVAGRCRVFGWSAPCPGVAAGGVATRLASDGRRR
jgi:hypothetical protein